MNVTCVITLALPNSCSLLKIISFLMRHCHLSSEDYLGLLMVPFCLCLQVQPWNLEVLIWICAFWSFFLLISRKLFISLHLLPCTPTPPKEKKERKRQRKPSSKIKSKGKLYQDFMCSLPWTDFFVLAVTWHWCQFVTLWNIIFWYVSNSSLFHRTSFTIFLYFQNKPIMQHRDLLFAVQI